MTPKTRDHLLKKYYLEDKSRQWTMQKLSIKNTNSMSSHSSRLGLHWSWSLENRKSGIAPTSKTKVSVAAAPRKPRTGDQGGGTAHALMARPSLPAADPQTSDHTGAETGAIETMLPMREKRLREFQDSDFNIGGIRSPYPAPSKELPFKDIAYIARHLYEGKPLP